MAGHVRTFLIANSRRCQSSSKDARFPNVGDSGGALVGLRVSDGSPRPWLVQSASRALLSSYQRLSSGGPGVRKRMMPLIKLVHPDLFAQYPPDVASTNSKSLRDLNTLIDAAEALEAAAAGIPESNGSVRSPASAPSVDPFYSLTFYHYSLEPVQERASFSGGRRQPSGNVVEGVMDQGWGGRGEGGRKASRNAQQEQTQGQQRQQQEQQIGRPSETDVTNHGDDGNDHDHHEPLPLLELRAELHFPPALSTDPSASLRTQLRRQLDGLVQRVQEAEVARRSQRRDGMGDDTGDGEEEEEDDDEREARALREGVRVSEGETEEEFYGRAFGGMFREAGMRRASRKHGPRMTSEEIRNMTIEHAGNNHHVDPGDSGFGSGFFDGGLGDSRGEVFGSFGGPAAAFQAKSRRVDDFLRSGRVQFAGVPVSREAAALARIHEILVDNFDDLELNDRGLWSTVVLVVRAKSDEYEVQAHPGGPLIIIPEKFTERNVLRFVAEVLLSYS